MKKTDKKLKALVLSLGLGVAMLTATSVQAQMINLLDEYYDELDQQSSDNAPLLQRSGAGDATITGSGITFDNFQDVDNVPLGSGIAILLVAGLGYVALKKKEDEQ